MLVLIAGVTRLTEVVDVEVARHQSKIISQLDVQKCPLVAVQVKLEDVIVGIAGSENPAPEEVHEAVGVEDRRLDQSERLG